MRIREWLPFSLLMQGADVTTKNQKKIIVSAEAKARLNEAVKN